VLSIMGLTLLAAYWPHDREKRDACSFTSAGWLVGRISRLSGFAHRAYLDDDLSEGCVIIDGRKGFRLLVLDFDRTISRWHMWETYEDAPIEDIPVNDATFVDITALRNLVKEAGDFGHQVAIATFGRRDVAEKAMSYAFGNDHCIAISTPADHMDAGSAYARIALVGDKNTQLFALAQKFKVQPSQVILLDDEPRNIQQAVKVGMRAKHVPRGLTHQVVRQVLDIIECRGGEIGEVVEEQTALESKRKWFEGLRRWILKRSKRVHGRRDGQAWMTLRAHTYNSLLQGDAEAGMGRHSRMMLVVRQSRKSQSSSAATLAEPIPHAWKMYVASVEKLLDGVLDRPDAIEPEAQRRYRRLCKLSRRGLLPHSLMPEDLNPSVSIVPASTVGAGDIEAPLKQLKEGLIFTLMDGDARVWVSNDTLPEIKCSFAETMLAAIIALRKTGHVHTDFKLDNVLFHGKEKPEWWLNDFDFVTPVNGPTPETPPMRALVENNLKESLQTPITGIEDFQCFVLVYSQLDCSVTTDQQAKALDFISKDPSAMMDFDARSFPRLGEFDPATVQW